MPSGPVAVRLMLQCFCFVFPLAQVARSHIGLFLAIFYLSQLKCAYMFMFIVVASPLWFICSAKFLLPYLLGTILNYCFLTFDIPTPVIILATSADEIFQYLVRYNGTRECYFRY